MSRRPPLPRRRRLRQGLPLRRAPHERLPLPPGHVPGQAPATIAELCADDRLALVALSLENALLSRELGRAQQRFSDWIDASARANAALEAALVRERGANLVHVTRQQVLREQLAARHRLAASARADDAPARRAGDLRARNRPPEAEPAALRPGAPGQAVDAPGTAVSVHGTPVSVHGTAAGRAAAAPRVLYVGGRSHQLPRLRALVERHGGQFAHVPGDGAPGDAGLAAALGQCDLVLLHASLLPGVTVRAVDAHCRRAGTPCVHLRRLCVRGFEQGLLEALGCRAPAADAS